MKKLTLFTALASSFAFGQSTQSISVEDYSQLKSSGGLDPAVHYQLPAAGPGKLIHYSGSSGKSDICDCMIPLDATFTLAMPPNDDLSSSLISLPFTFSFYGNPFNSVYINNNGSISFTTPYSTFTGTPFPDPAFEMIAPFWGDVDTRGIGNVWYKVTQRSLIVIWDRVGYYNAHIDKENTFQLIISNGFDPLIPVTGSNVAFCYGDMQWTTGDASGGVGGFGGAPASVGLNHGPSGSFFQVGLFDQPGTLFDGPLGMNDQVDFLDNMEMYFDASGPSIPPLVVAAGICDTIDVFTGDTLKSIHSVDFTVMAAASEINQTLQVDVTCPEYPDAVAVTQIPGENGFVTADIRFDANSVPPGMYHVVVTATAMNNGIPTTTTVKNIPIRVQGASLGQEEFTDTFSMYPNPASDKLNVRLNNGKQAFVELIDLLGNTVYSGEIDAAKAIDIAHLNAGVYLVKVTTGNNVSSIRFVKD